MNTNLFWLLPIILAIVFILVKLSKKNDNTSISMPTNSGGGTPPPTPTDANLVNKDPLK
jgi:hypothetical protein